ncbi:hypothetical protein QVD17_00252 [Tagetes erecta]|uniref:Uncharacterized protein n=1 Tax=Tagetes erecta TaxID=13708 RepID=A0AAD8P6U3_TARER|nr:hypothetical protein QVD17_00252 [Tagetes erecta]
MLDHQSVSFNLNFISNTVTLAGVILGLGGDCSAAHKALSKTSKSKFLATCPPTLLMVDCIGDDCVDANVSETTVGSGGAEVMTGFFKQYKKLKPSCKLTVL